jgi:PRTRC genetic system protein C
VARIFVYDGREFPDPDPNQTPDEVRITLSNLLPELANAETKHSTKDGDDVYEFRKRVGTKG